MSFLKQAKSAMKDIQDIQKGLKDFGIIGKKSNDKSSPSSAGPPSVAAHSTGTPTAAPSIAAPSITASSAAASNAAFTPGTTPAASVIAPSTIAPPGDLTVPPCTEPGAPTKVPLANRKNIRDEFEAKKPELEQEFSALLGAPWTIYIDTTGVFSYMGQYTGGNAVPGLILREYFEGALDWLRSFKEQYGAAEAATINTLAPRRIITLEPTTDSKYTYNGTDFFEGRWRILFRDTMFGSNTRQAADKLAEVVNRADKAGGGGGGKPALSLNAQKSIRDEYEAKMPQVLSDAQSGLAAPTLAFQPNFETNYATLAAYAASPEGKKLRDDWEKTLGSATHEYFSGFVSQLGWQNFNGDDLMQEGFKDSVSKQVVAFLVVDKISRMYNDCVIEDGVLVIRTIPQYWWSNANDACAKLGELL